jgi:hypothetical protein
VVPLIEFDVQGRFVLVHSCPPMQYFPKWK